MTKYNFKNILISKGIISEEELSNLVQLYHDDELEIILHLIREGIAQRDYLGQLCGDSLGVAYTNLDTIIFQPDLLQMLPEKLVRTYKIIPLYQFGGIVTVVTTDPKNLFILDKVEKILECQVSALFSFPDEIDQAIEDQYSNRLAIQAQTRKLASSSQTKINNSSSVKTNITETHIFSEKAKEELISSSKEIINDTFEGKVPKVSTTEKIRSMIIEQVNDKIDIIFGFHQLRIKDEYTYSHCVNVAALTALLSKVLGMNINEIKELTLGALLHDIGKMRIPKVILYKPSRLTPDEIEIARRHPQLGYQIIKMMGLPVSVANIALNHHERIDGKGYPRKLKGDAISLYSQVVSIADVYDKMVSDRPSRAAVNHHEALNIMLLEGDQAFSNSLLKIFVSIALKQNYESLKEKFKSSVYGEIV